MIHGVGRTFLKRLGQIPAAASGERDGCVVGFTTQCSIDPPLFLVCLSDKNRTWRIAQEAESLAVHAVPRERRLPVVAGTRALITRNPNAVRVGRVLFGAELPEIRVADHGGKLVSQFVWMTL